MTRAAKGRSAWAAVLGLAAGLLAVALPAPASASATSPSYAETRGRGFEVQNPAGVGAERGLSPTSTEAYGLRYDELAVGYPLVPRAAAAADDLVDLTTPARRQHILEGDVTGGGHRPGTGIPGKSEFPAGWSDDRIIHSISDIATDPAAVRTAGRGGRTIVTGTRDGVEIRVVLEADGTVVTGYPTNVPRNP